MESAKSALAVALADERHGAGWRRPRTRARIAAVLASLLAATVVFGLFNRFGLTQGERQPERQLIATIDLRLGNAVFAAERGATQARTDIEAGLLQLQTSSPAESQTRAEAAKARRLEQRYGVTWLHKGGASSAVSEAYMDGYNRVMQAEIERRHGRRAVDELLPKQDQLAL